MIKDVLSPTIFRAYDIRGIAGDTLNAQTIFQIGQAIGSLIREKGETQIALARDGRLSGPALSQALREGLLATGCDVTDIGQAPTPLLYYAAHVFTEHSGVMLTGSHNPPDYNGLKIVIQGCTLAEEGIRNLYQRILEKRFVVGAGVYRQVNIAERYIYHMTHNVTLARPLKIVIDAGNGVTGEIAPALFKQLGCNVIPLFCEIDGTFPNHHPDPSQAENMQDLIKAVREHQADLGLAFDGDGDRLGVVTSAGEIINPDRLLMVFAKALLLKKPHSKIIYDIKCTQHLDKLIRAHHGVPLMWKTGHSLIKAKVAETGALLAGEMSGHFFFNDRWYGFDDALYAGARLLEIVSEQAELSAEFFAAVPNSVNTPELKILVEEEEKFALMDRLREQAHFADAEDIITFDGVRVNFAKGWGLVRPSNTSPYLILRFEAINETMLVNIQNLFRSWLLSVKPDLVLPF
ncbi:MAG: phosphomannomutase/phosphoglucomutase [Gammaproteobacteria bacterium]|nr:phosphomannomutase/phosphoglucomutase [Gammaproteobacteria bacterium]